MNNLNNTSESVKNENTMYDKQCKGNEVLPRVRQGFSSITDFEEYIADECKKRFEFVCEPFTIAKCFLYVDAPKNKVEDVKKLVFESMPSLKNCDIQMSRYFSGFRTLEFTP